jgi:hypothetical protein
MTLPGLGWREASWSAAALRRFSLANVPTPSDLALPLSLNVEVSLKIEV